MAASKRWILPGLLALAAAVAGPMSAGTRAATEAIVTIEALPGTIVRWSVPGTKRCGMVNRSWDALQETCYYPARIPAIGP